MARWEIQRVDQPPVVIEVDDTRNLATEWQAFSAKRKRTLKDRVWRPADGCALDARLIVGVVKVQDHERKRRARIAGFHGN